MGARKDTNQFCNLCGEPAGHIATCHCTVDCGDLLCAAAPIPSEEFLMPPVPSFR